MAIDWVRIQRFSKALAAGLSAAVATTSSTAIVYVAVPATAGLPGWLWAAIPLINAAIGFVLGFSGTYAAPPNLHPVSPTTPPSTTTP
jgi:hypothetical protein